MPRFVFFLLTLGLLAAQSPAGSAILEAVLSSEPAESGESPDRGWGMDPDGSPTSSEADRGWAIDPDG